MHPRQVYAVMQGHSPLPSPPAERSRPAPRGCRGTRRHGGRACGCSRCRRTRYNPADGCSTARPPAATEPTDPGQRGR
uniref:Uncharacterized protein n=1 Tax=uncultured marine virus TaxID=186617 RepID=A0A0F7L6M4_9VIRU|nr:hypothetical protein [uncultured marine virus]